MAKKQTWQQVYADMQKEEEEQKWWQGWFQKGAFADGFDWSDIPKTYLGLRADLSQNIFSAVIDATENLMDTTAYITGIFGGDEYKQKVGEFIAKDTFKKDETAKWIYDHIPYDALGVNIWSKYVIGDNVEDTSLFNEKTDSLVQSVAHQVGSRALNMVGVPWQLTTGVNTFGSEAEEAFSKDAGFWETGVSGLISAGAEIGAESLFSGSTLGEKGLINLDSLTSGIKNKAIKALADFGLDMAKEGAEEMASNFASSLGQAIYESDNPQEYWEVVQDKNSFDNLMTAFVSGAAMSGMGNFTNVASSVKNQTDYRTGLTAQEQTVFDAVYDGKVKDYVSEYGKNPTGKAKKQIFTDTLNELNTGAVSISKIGSVIAPQTQKNYDEVTNKLNAAQQEYDQLSSTDAAEMTEEQTARQAQLQDELARLKQEQQDLDDRIASFAKGTRMEESYRERDRRRQAYQDDASRYENESARQTVQNIIDSGVVNNTRRSHEFVNMLAKLSADKGIFFTATDAQRLKETGLSVDGAVVNGYYTESGVAININSPRALESVVGHEVAHALEGSQFAEPLKQAVISYAQSKGEYDSLMDPLTRLYSGKPGYETDFQAKMEKELVADLIGKYLFTDADFVRNLSVQNRNLFQRLFDEIKYLLRVAKAGSKEARQLEKIKKLFEEAYRNAKNTAPTDGIKFSLMAFEKDGRRYVEIDQAQDRFDGHSVDEYPRIAKDIINEKFNHQVVGIDNKMYVNSAGRDEFANPSKRIPDDIYQAKMRTAGELDNLLDAGTNFRNEPDGADGHKHPDVIGGFDYFDTLFKIGSRYFEAVINIKNVKNGKLFKDVTKIEDVTQDIMSSYGKNPKSQFLRTSSMNRIRQDAQNVNPKLSLSEDTGAEQAEGKNTYSRDVAVEPAAQEQSEEPQTDTEQSSGIVLSKRAMAEIIKEIKTSLGVPDHRTYDVQQIVQAYLNGEIADRQQLFDRLKEEFGVIQDRAVNEKVRDVKKYLKNYRLQVSDSVKNEIPDFRDLTRRNRHKIGFSRQGTPVDMAYREMAENYPEFFPEIIYNPTDQLMRIIEVANTDMYEDVSYTTDDDTLWGVTDDIIEYVEDVGEKVQPASSAETDANTETEKPLEENAANKTERPKRVLTPAGLRRAKLYDLETEYANAQYYRKETAEKFNEAIKEKQSEYARKKDKKTRTANKLLAQISKLHTRKAELDAYWEKKENDLRKKIYRERSAQANKALKDTEQDISQEIAEKAERLTGDKSKFIQRRASELFKEIETLKTGGGIRASAALDYLLEQTENKNWKPLKVALLNIQDNPTEIVNVKSRMELLVRDALKAEYKAKQMDWVEVFSFTNTKEDADTPSAKISQDVKALADKVLNDMEKRDRLKASQSDYIQVLQNRYNKIADKQSEQAQKLSDDIELKKADNKAILDSIQEKIDSTTERIGRMMSPEYRTAKQKEYMHDQYFQWAEKLVGNTTTWTDKKYGWQYMAHNLRRNLREIVKDENGNPDYAKADAIYEELQGMYNFHEAELNRELTKIQEKYRKLKITKQEDVYIQMLGEFRHNPQSELSLEKVEDFYNANKSRIDSAKVDKVIEMARKDYDNLIQRINEVLRSQGLKEIPYRKGYFPHFTSDPQSKLAKLLNWNTKNDDIPTSIAGMTESFEPIRSYQSFNKERTSDITDYSFMRGFDQYTFGALDWIYHIADIQKRRALENYIRYVHSDEGVKAKIDAIKNSEEYDAEEAQKQIDAVYAEAKNPLNNFVVDLRRGTQSLAAKKSPLDREVEALLNRKAYSIISNVSNRVSANMVVGSVRAALTNTISIIQSWGGVNPLRTVGGLAKFLRYTVSNESSAIDQSVFVTNRLRKAEKLFKTGWDKVSDFESVLASAIDSMATQTIWWSRYDANRAKKMSEAEAIHDADLFTAGVMADRSRGNLPTIFESKNPLIKMVTAFQLENANQYDYMYKDIPQDAKDHVVRRSAYAHIKMYIGAFFLNELFIAMFGSAVANDPIRILKELLLDILDAVDEDDEKDMTWGQVAGNFVEDVAQEIPFLGGLIGGGRVPISSAVPYSNIKDLITGSASDAENWTEGGWKALGKEWSKLLFYGVIPMGGGQFKKTIEGLSMFTGDKPVSGSYTTDGNLRFSVEPTAGNVIQAALFGQWASDEAQQYIDEGRKPLSEKQTKEYAALDIPMEQYWEIRDNLNRITNSDSETKQADKVDYINSLDLSVEQKNILVNNILDRKEKVDLTDYDKFGSWAEFDFYIHYPEKYKFLKQNGISYADYAHDKDAYNWAYQNQAKYAVAKIFLSDFTQYYTYRRNISAIESQKDASGNTIEGSQKLLRARYIGSLNITKIEKAILMKQYYPSFTDADNAIVQFVTSTDSLTKQEKIVILHELGILPDELNLFAYTGG